MQTCIFYFIFAVNNLYQHCTYWRTHVHIWKRTIVTVLCCFVCRLRLLLGLWDHSVATRLPHLPSSLTHIMSTSASPLMASAPTKASLSTSRPEVLQLPRLRHNGKRMFVMKLITNYRCFHMWNADKVCPAVVTPHSRATPQQPQYSQGQSVTVTCVLGHVANTVSETENQEL